MELRKNVGDRQRLARTAFAVVLSVVAIRSFQRGKRLRAALAGVGALALGLEVPSQPGELTEMVGTTDEDVELRCAACGQPIRPGQLRGPNENNEIVHEDCKAEVR
jgi:hypothetical protein